MDNQASPEKADSMVASKPQEVHVPNAEAETRRAKYMHVFTPADDDFILKMIEAQKPMVFIAEKLGCSRKGLGEYIHRTPILQEAYTNAKDAMDDLAEVRLLEKINQGDLGAIMFYMPRRMRHRGYGDQPFIEPNQEDNRIVIGKIDLPDEDEQTAQITDVPSEFLPSPDPVPALPGAAEPAAQDVPSADAPEALPSAPPDASAAEAASVDDEEDEDDGDVEVVVEEESVEEEDEISEW